MDRFLTSEELRIAARQAITVALAMKDEASRDDMLFRAQRLLDEARELPITRREGECGA
jgi:hypothetical protein